MQARLKYGTTEETIDVAEENLLAVAEPPKVTVAEDEATVLTKALAEPVGTPRLRELARGKRNATIIISDQTRPTPSRRILPFLLEELRAGGIEEGQVSVVIATGLHVLPDQATLARMLGEDLLSRVRVVVHNADAPDLVDVGHTSNGTPVKVNPVVAGADILVSVSTVDPHHLYGWSGGAKNIIPGVSSRETVNVHHGRTRTHRGGVDRLEGNIFREDAEEAARMVGLDFILNVILNEQRMIIGAVAGDVVAGHRQLVAMARRLVSVPVGRLADILVVGVGGPPRDADFWQAQGKGMLSTLHAVRDGGIMILVAGCEKGLGPEAFSRYMHGTMQEIHRWHQEENYSVPLSKAFDTAAFTERCGLYLVTPGLEPGDLPHFAVKFFSSVKEALEAARRELGRDAKVLVVPDGSRVVVSLAS